MSKTVNRLWDATMFHPVSVNVLEMLRKQLLARSWVSFQGSAIERPALSSSWETFGTSIKNLSKTIEVPLTDTSVPTMSEVTLSTVMAGARVHPVDGQGHAMMPDVCGNYRCDNCRASRPERELHARLVSSQEQWTVGHRTNAQRPQTPRLARCKTCNFDYCPNCCPISLCPNVHALKAKSSGFFTSYDCSVCNKRQEQVVRYVLSTHPKSNLIKRFSKQVQGVQL